MPRKIHSYDFAWLSARISPCPNTGCWFWCGTYSGKNYASARVNRLCTYVHRFSYELFKGPIPAGMQVDHLCRVHFCVNPDHLELVTNRENGRRGLSVQRAREMSRIMPRGDHGKYLPLSHRPARPAKGRGT